MGMRLQDKLKIARQRTQKWAKGKIVFFPDQLDWFYKRYKRG